ncbi:MAG: META domain-containing protein [Planctomycetota bacterium]|jgi:heat shock protein HslJ
MKKTALCVIFIAAVLMIGCETPQKQTVETRELITSQNYSKIAGMQWILESMKIDGKVYSLAKQKPFIQFEMDNKVNGFASVNRFFGGVQVDEEGQITWPGPFGTTRMAGPPILMQQEDAFVKALPKTEQMSVAGIRLYAYTKDRSTELVFLVPVR